MDPTLAAELEQLNQMLSTPLPEESGWDKTRKILGDVALAAGGYYAPIGAALKGVRSPRDVDLQRRAELAGNLGTRFKLADAMNDMENDEFQKKTRTLREDQMKLGVDAARLRNTADQMRLAQEAAANFEPFTAPKPVLGVVAQPWAGPVGQSALTESLNSEDAARASINQTLSGGIGVDYGPNDDAGLNAEYAVDLGNGRSVVPKGADRLRAQKRQRVQQALAGAPLDDDQRSYLQGVADIEGLGLSKQAEDRALQMWQQSHVQNVADRAYNDAKWRPDLKGKLRDYAAQRYALAKMLGTSGQTGADGLDPDYKREFELAKLEIEGLNRQMAAEVDPRVITKLAERRDTLIAGLRNFKPRSIEPDPAGDAGGSPEPKQPQPAPAKPAQISDADRASIRKLQMLGEARDDYEVQQALSRQAGQITWAELAQNIERHRARQAVDPLIRTGDRKLTPFKK
jgi:hypothetical protein